jgi:hypothetical protein
MDDRSASAATPLRRDSLRRHACLAEAHVLMEMIEEVRRPFGATASQPSHLILSEGMDRSPPTRFALRRDRLRICRAFAKGPGQGPA